jgi:magnesium transporter
MPARLLVKDSSQTTERPPEDLSELRDRPCWLDISDPQSKDFELAAKELNLHPLAVEDARQRHERPKIDQYDDHYFIVFYALQETTPGVVREIEISIFMLQNAIVTVHEGEFTARAAVEKRFREGKLHTTGLLLHALLDTMVDQYFPIIDALGDRVELLETMVVGGETHDYDTSIRELFELSATSCACAISSRRSATSSRCSCAGTFASCVRSAGACTSRTSTTTSRA